MIDGVFRHRNTTGTDHMTNRFKDLIYGRGPHHHQLRGATLIELSVVVVIIALIVAGALVSFRQVQRSQTITEAAGINSQLVSAIARIAGAVGPSGSGLIACGSGGCSMNTEAATTIAQTLGNNNLESKSRNCCTVARSTNPGAQTGFSDANSWGGNIILYAFNARSLVVRHTGVPDYAITSLVNALELGAQTIVFSAEAADLTRLTSSSSLNYTGSNYVSSVYSGNASHVDGLYQF